MYVLPGFSVGDCLARLIRAVRGVVLAGMLAGPVSAESLGERISATPSGQIVALPAETIPGRTDISGIAEIRGLAGSGLSAPDDDTILAVLPGAELRLSGVDLLQAGLSKFAIYIDGGAVWLEDCRIAGAFEVAIYVASGSLVVTDCDIDGGLYGIQAAPGASVTLANVRMTGQGDTAIRVDGAALDITGLTVTAGGLNGLVVTGSPEFHADGLTLSGILDIGLWVQDTALADLRRIVVEVSGQALTVTGGAAFTLDGFVLQGAEGAFSADAVAGDVALTRGRMQSGEAATTAILRDIGALRLDDVEIAGGETGLYLSGALPGAGLDRVLLHSQVSTGLFVDGVASGDHPLAFAGLRAIAAGTALPAYFRNSGPVRFARSGLIAAGALPYAIEGTSSPEFRDSALISAPDFAEGHQVFDAAPGDPPSFLPFGALWWSGDFAIVPGTVAMTLADLAESLPLDTGLQQAVVAFGSAQSHSPKAVALALDQALPVAETASDVTALAEVSLAPPEAGWTWDATAVRITLTGRDGVPISAVPGDFPLTVPTGDYSLTVDGRAAGRVAVGQGSILDLPLPDAPFYAWRDADGRKIRGPALYLRPPAELGPLMAGFRPLRPGEYWGYTPQFAPRRGADRALAAGIIAEARSEIPAMLMELSALQASEIWADFNRRWQVIDMTLDIMAQFGSREDAAWLLALPIPADIQIDQLETAVLIEMRLGSLADGAALPAARAHLAGFAAGDRTMQQSAIRLVRAVARSGLPEATPLLADLQRALATDVATDPPNPLGVVELSRLGARDAGGLPTRYLDQLARHLTAHLDAKRPADEPALRGTDHWNAAVAALAFEAIHAPPGTATRRLPIPVDAGIGASAWAFADPERLMLGPLDLVGPPDPHSLNGWTYRIPEYICAALAYRNPVDRLQRLESLRQQVIATITPAVTPDEEEGNAAIMADQYDQVAFALDLILGECVLSDSVLNSFGRNAGDEEAAIFDNLDYEPIWWQRPERARRMIADFAAGGEFPALHGHSAAPLAEVETALATGSAGYPPLQKVFLARHRLISDAFQSEQDALTFGAEHRQFRLRSDGGNGTATIAGYLDIRPVLANGRLIVAIRHRIESPDYGGLAAMITEPDRTPYERNNRILMFEAVTLDHAGVEVALQHEGTSTSGVQFYAVPSSGDLSDLTLHLSMRFMETRWEIGVPLWGSALAHDQRSGRLPKAEASE